VNAISMWSAPGLLEGLRVERLRQHRSGRNYA
jgi:hypothetical protein